MAAADILKLQRAGFSEQQVEALAGYFDEQMVTKADLAAAEARLHGTVEQVRSDIALVRADVATGDAKLETKIEQSRSDTIKWVVGVAFAQAAMIFAMLRFFPAGHPWLSHSSLAGAAAPEPVITGTVPGMTEAGPPAQAAGWQTWISRLASRSRVLAP